MSEAAIEKVDSTALSAKSIDVVEEASRLVVKDEAGLGIASTLLAGIKALLGQASDLFDDNVRRWDHGHKAAIADRKKITGPLLTAQKRIKGEVSEYHNRLRIAAEKARREAEAEERKREEERRLAAAVQLEEAGHEDAAEALLETPAPIARPMISTPPPPKTVGLGIGTKRTAKVVDLLALQTFVAANPVWAMMLVANQKRLDKLASDAKDRPDGYELLPGVKLVIEATVASRKWS